jgi:CO/xanthine dehydrogenase Mo-binding subunit
MVAMACEMPKVRMAEMETFATTNPLGVRGIGETGTIAAAPALVNAVARIVEHGGGAREGLFTLPLRHDRVRQAMNARE